MREEGRSRRGSFSGGDKFAEPFSSGRFFDELSVVVRDVDPNPCEAPSSSTAFGNRIGAVRPGDAIALFLNSTKEV